jgi:hypothetical protein
MCCLGDLSPCKVAMKGRYESEQDLIDYKRLELLRLVEARVVP